MVIEITQSNRVLVCTIAIIPSVRMSSMYRSTCSRIIESSLDPDDDRTIRMSNQGLASMDGAAFAALQPRREAGFMKHKVNQRDVD